MFQSITFPSLTICHQNGFKNHTVKLKHDMNQILLLSKSRLSNWPNDSMKVKDSWNAITYELEDLIQRIGVRYDGGTYCYGQTCTEDEIKQSKCCKGN